jgi:hypothetical protein
LATKFRQKDVSRTDSGKTEAVGPILFITAAGGVLGRVISVSDIVPFIKSRRYYAGDPSGRPVRHSGFRRARRFHLYERFPFV